MYLKLFNEKPIKDLFADSYVNIENRIKASNISFFNIRQIYDEFQLNMPKLCLDKANSELNLEDRNGKVYQENSSGRYDGLDVYVTAAITIPISGDENYFGLRPSLNHSQVGYHVQLNSGKLEFKIRVNSLILNFNEHSSYIEKEANNFFDFIKNNLANLDNDFLDFNESIIPLITKLLEEKKLILENKRTTRY